MKNYLICLIILTTLSPHFAVAADGATTLKVQGVQSNDVLNLRDAPNWKSNKVGEIPHDGRCILNLGCPEALTPSEPNDLPVGQQKKANKNQPIWCQVSYHGLAGWASGAYLAEDHQCNDNLPTTSEEEMPLTQVMHRIADALNHKNYRKITTDYIDPNIGLYMLYNPGAATYPYHFKSFEDFMKNSPSIYLYENKTITLGDFHFENSGNACDLKMEKLPNFCEPEKEGCFAETPTNYHALKNAAYAQQYLSSPSGDMSENEIT